MLLENWCQSTGDYQPTRLTPTVKDFPSSHLLLFKSNFARLLENYDHEVIARTSMANFEVLVYGITGDNKLLLSYGDLIQFGMEKLVLFGTCGVLDRDIEATIIIPSAALRGRGPVTTIFQAGDEVEVNKEYLSSKPFWTVTRFPISPRKSVDDRCTWAIIDEATGHLCGYECSANMA